MGTTCLTVCPECNRHLRCGERVCPFCGARVESFLRVLEFRLKARLSRGQGFSLGAALAAVGIATLGNDIGCAVYGGPCLQTDSCEQGGWGGVAGSGGHAGSGGYAGSAGHAGGSVATAGSTQGGSSGSPTGGGGAQTLGGNGGQTTHSAGASAETGGAGGETTGGEGGAGGVAPDENAGNGGVAGGG